MISFQGNDDGDNVGCVLHTLMMVMVGDECDPDDGDNGDDGKCHLVGRLLHRCRQQPVN